MRSLGWFFVLVGAVVFGLSALPLAHYLLLVKPAGTPVGLGWLLWVRSQAGCVIAAAGLATALASRRPGACPQWPARIGEDP
jgi:hypothetical protein